MPFEVTILGNNSAVAAFGRHPTAQMLNINHKNYLIDCGEGTQFQINRYHLKPSKIEAVFISHLHGDHYFGLVGLLTSFGLNKRTDKLTIYGPPLLKDIIHIQIGSMGKYQTYPLEFVPLEMGEEYRLCETNDFTVDTVKLTHGVPCMGFVFNEKPRELNIISEKIGEYGLSIDQIKAAKQGSDIQLNGKLIPNKELTEPPYKTRSYAFCTDTAFDEAVAEKVKGVDLLYHEATFDSSAQARAAETGHSTSLQAGEIAKKAEVDRLLIGHFSSRYHELDNLLEEARTVFSNTDIAVEGETYTIEQQRLAAL